MHERHWLKWAGEQGDIARIDVNWFAVKLREAYVAGFEAGEALVLRGYKVIDPPAADDWIRITKLPTPQKEEEP